MRGILTIGLAISASALFTSFASASLSVALVPVIVPPSDPARTASPNPYPSNARTFDLTITQTGEEFALCDLQMTLGSGAGLSGSLYAPAGHMDRYQRSPATPQLNYDTYFTTPQFSAGTDIFDPTMGGLVPPTVDILGGADYPVSPPPPQALTAGNNTQTLNLVWGDHRADLSTQPNGAYRIARITVVGNTGAFLNGYVEGTVTTTPVFFNNLYLPILGDTNGDHVVDATDLSNVTLGHADTNNDGVSDASDVANVTNNLGNSLPVPEPMGALVIAPFAALARAARRKQII